MCIMYITATTPKIFLTAFIENSSLIPDTSLHPLTLNIFTN